MAIYYRTITVNTTAPSSPALGELWIKPIASTSYSVYIWLNSWVLWVGGGSFATEADADTNYLNVIIQETLPDALIQTGWIYIKESILTAYLYLFGTYIPIAIG